MSRFPLPARSLVASMEDAASADPMRAIAFQGAPGANSHAAALAYDESAPPLPCFGFADAIDAVKDGRAGRAVIPIENSQNGRVADIHFLLPESGLAIVDELFLPIHHCLMAADPHGAVQQALSHPQALGQCRHWLRERDIEPVAFADTASAAAEVAERRMPGIAAIAPALAANLYDLAVIAANIEDAADNMTRFVVLAPEPRPAADLVAPVMTTFVFEVKNIPAALYKALGGFATNGVNMTKLESYQRGASFSATAFYADIEGMPGDPAIDRALDELRFHCKEFRMLGSYRQARPRG